MLFFFSSRRRHTRFDCDWSSDVCSSDLILDRSQDLLLERSGSTIPELKSVVPGIEDRGRLAPALAASYTNRELTRVRPARPRIVAEGATDRVSFRQPSVEEEHLAELHFLIGLEIVSRDRHVRKRAKGQVRLLAQAALGTEHQQNSRCSGEDDFQAHTGSYDHRQILSMSQESYLRTADNGLRSPLKRASGTKGRKSSSTPERLSSPVSPSPQGARAC